MCGIVGRAGQLATEDERVFKVMLLLDYFRGQDSTGVASITKGGAASVLKMADDPIMLFKNKEYEETVSGAYDAIWIGHNRYATIGSTSRENAHPFMCDHITGVHNGTLTKPSFTSIASFIKEDFDTDSQTIFQNIAVYGVEDTIKRLQGAWALVWYDSKEQTLNMIRNAERPLFTCVSERDGKKTMSWASEYEMIAAAREMSGAKAMEKLEADEEGYAYFPLPIDTLHTWTLDQLKDGNFEAKTKYMPGRPKDPPPVTQIGYYTGGQTNTGSSTTFYETKEDTYNVMRVEGALEGEQNLILGEFDAMQWEEMAGYGCAVCGNDIDEHAEGLLVCVQEGVVLCPNCSESKETTIINSISQTNLAALL